MMDQDRKTPSAIPLVAYRERLEGKRVVLRKARMTDLPYIYRRVWHDGDVIGNTFLNYSEDYASASDRLRRTIGFQKDRPLYFLALKDRKTVWGSEAVIGLGGIEEEAPGVWSEATLALGRRWQRMGYGGEMLSLLLDYAFGDLGADSFAYYAMTHNTASKALAAKFGFTLDSISEHIHPNGTPVLVERFLLTRDAWLAGRSHT